MLFDISKFITETLQKKSSNSIHIGDWFSKLKDNIAKQATEEQMIKLANSDGFRQKLLLAGRNDYDFKNGFSKLADVRKVQVKIKGKKKKREIKAIFFGEKSRDFCDDAAALRLEYVKLIFDAQDNRDFFYYMSPGGLFLSWIMPNCFKQFEMSYQTDHILALRRDGLDSLENFGFFSANTNIYVKNQMTIDEVLNLYSMITPLCDRIKKNMERRKILFASLKWIDYLTRIKRFEIEFNSEPNANLWGVR